MGGPGLRRSLYPPREAARLPAACSLQHGLVPVEAARQPEAGS